MFGRKKTRVIAGVAALAVGAATFFAVNPSANAALQPHYVGGIDHTTGATTVVPGATAPQAAGDWVTTPLGAVEAATANDIFGILVTLDDTVTSAGIPILQPPTTTCKPLSQTVSFASTPTVKNLTTTGPGSAATFATKVQSSSFCASAGVNDQLVIYATGGDAAGAQLQISGITYKVGATVAVGPIPYKVANNAGTETFTTAASNAIVSNVTAKSSAFQTLVPPGKTTTLPAFSITEIVKGAIPASGVCVAFVHPPTAATFGAAVPSVTATGGSGAGTPGTVVMSPDNLSFFFPTTLSTAATTYTVHGLQLASTAPNPPTKPNLGAIDVDVRAGACSPAGALLAPGVRLGTIGAVARLAGATRYETAGQLAVSEGRFAGKTVVIARGDNFPDALAASYLAGQNGVPILLTRASELPTETQIALAQIGATDVVIVGGPNAVSTGVEDALRSLFVYDATDQQHPVATNAHLTVARVGGADRYETAKLVAERNGISNGGTLGARVNGTCTPLKAGILASGENFPDALAAGGLAYHGASPTGGCGAGPLPLLLTPSGSLSAFTAQAISDMQIKVILLVGGPNAVSTAVENQLTAGGIVVRRVSGATRQDTAVALNHDIIGNPNVANWSSAGLIASRPDTFPDALAASSISGLKEAPIYLTSSGSDIGQNVIDGILAYPTPTYLALLMGGTDALSNDVATGFAVLLASQPG